MKYVDGRTSYAVFPLKCHYLEADEELIVSDIFHSGVRVVMLSLPGKIGYVAYVEGGGAHEIKEKKIRLLKVLEVSEISGCGQAVDPLTDPELRGR